ncbi:MAG TPA: hypothetical protein VL970_15315, partial [Candidatus Acidoferrales bacterium]|nr:hypothetical protein [Candidatus Acidoferrales bacterium]
MAGLLSARAQEDFPLHETNSSARIVVVQGVHLLDAFLPDEERVEAAFNRGLTFFTSETNVSAAWRSLVTTNDTVGIKVFSTPGPVCGTRPAVVAAIVRGLLTAGLPADHIIIWDRHLAELRMAGFTELGSRLGVRVEGAQEAGYDTNAFYLPDSPIVGQLVWGDLEFGKTNQDLVLGKKSYLSKLVSQQMTKIISVAPLMNELFAGVCGHFFSLTLGSVDNTRRFEGNPERLAVALPEIDALPLIGDRVALHVTDALLLQYEGGPQGYLQFSQVRNELWFSHDPVALDVMALKELMLQRRLLSVPPMPANFGIYTNAALLQLGVNDPARIQIDKVSEPV